VFNIQAFRYYNAADFFIQTTVAIWRVEDNGEKQPGQKYHGATKDRHTAASVNWRKSQVLYTSYLLTSYLITVI